MHIDGFEEVYTKWEQKRKQARNPSAAQQKNGKKEQLVKEQLYLEKRMDAIIDWDRGARLEKKTDDIKSDTGAIRAKQEEDSQLIRGLVDQVGVIAEVVVGGVMPEIQPDQSANARMRSLRNCKRFQDTQIGFLKDGASPTEALQLAGDVVENRSTAVVEAKAAKAKVREEAKATKAKEVEEAKAAKAKAREEVKAARTAAASDKAAAKRVSKAAKAKGGNRH
jgi:hypothetical protein